jgi:hypothetical protein
MGRIVVNIASPDPLEGHVTTTRDDAPAAFVGWLGLIRLIADAVEADPQLGWATNQVREEQH